MGINSAYDWNTAMAGTGLTGADIFSGGNTGYTPTQTLPTGLSGAPAMGAADFNFGSATASGSLGYGMGGNIPMGVTPGPGAAPGGFMGALRGQPGVAGDGLTGWLGNGQNLGAVMNGIGALTSAWTSYGALKNAKEGLNFQKKAFGINLKNSTQSYNTSLEDRIRGRTSDYAGKEADVQAYLDKNKLSGG